MYLASLTQNFYNFALLYGVIIGLVLGSLYITPITHCYKYFPYNKSMITGLIIGGNGIGTMLFSLMSISIINPNN